MAHLLDTNILIRLANTTDVAYPIASRSIVELHRRGEVLHVTAQVLIEFRNVATRPPALNGLGLSTLAAQAKAAAFEATFPLLVETPDIFPAWKALVDALGVIGKQVHDARLVAVCHAHNVASLLTFNVSHFSRMAGFGPGLLVVDPASV
jgi:predicted nucleic acid-binding protein